jgi:alpha-methylacyl-CoA racemase
MSLDPKQIPDRQDKANWPALRSIYTEKFKSKTRAEWEKIFDGTDACCTPVLTQAELEAQNFDQRPAVTLKGSPGYAIQEGDDGRPAAVGQGIGVEGSGWVAKALPAGTGGEEVLGQWFGWKRGRQYEVSTKDEGLEWKDSSKL